MPSRNVTALRKQKSDHNNRALVSMHERCRQLNQILPSAYIKRKKQQNKGFAAVIRIQGVCMRAHQLEQVTKL
jgi:hypothetical protein